MRLTIEELEVKIEGKPKMIAIYKKMSGVVTRKKQVYMRKVIVGIGHSIVRKML